MFLNLWGKKKRVAEQIQAMTGFIADGEFVDWSVYWQECSCSGRNDLIHYLNGNEEAFRRIVAIDFDKRIAGVTTDILSIDGICSSKSPVNNYVDLNEFAFSLITDAKIALKSSTAIGFVTDQDFKDNCNYVKRECDKLHGIAVQHWNNKKYILNDDCSHHLAAIYRQCKEQGRTYLLHLDIVPETIDVEKLQQLLNQYYLVFADRSNIKKLDDKYYALFKRNAFAMHDHHSYDNQSCLFPLKKNLDFNQTVVEMLKKRNDKFLILNDELNHLLMC